jgi:hypothetical protein
VTSAATTAIENVIDLWFSLPSVSNGYELATFYLEDGVEENIMNWQAALNGLIDEYDNKVLASLPVQDHYNQTVDGASLVFYWQDAPTALNHITAGHKDDFNYYVIQFNTGHYANWTTTENTMNLREDGDWLGPYNYY